MEPLLGIWDGLYLLSGALSEEEALPYVQDALDELEFIMGNTSTEYGALRESLGYPEPWNIKYLEIGNEDMLAGGLESYEEWRLKLFYDPIKAKYPDMVLISSTTEVSYGDSAGDFHIYARPDELVALFDQFDNFYGDNLVLVGEYAVQQANSPTNPDVDDSIPRALFPFWIGSIAEAVFNIGMERNSHRMIGSAYAPLMANWNGPQWAVSDTNSIISLNLFDIQAASGY
jgi:alpha-N-arabinofuranosidase